MLSSHIEDIITALKAKPNGLWRNKAISHAYDTLASVYVLESTMPPTGKVDGRTEPLTASKCICRPGIVDSKCPLHGQQ